MRLRLATTIAAATALLPLAMAAPAHANPVYDTNGPAVTVYNTPGGHIVNGRLWNTTCATYSTTTVRCTTTIWSTKITYNNGKFTTTTGWVFNNLTYLPSTRTAWTKNPLGAYGKFKGTASWTSAGLKWRTECDTAATGTGACRSYIWTTYPALTAGKYAMKTGWVFNNLVTFSSTTIKPVSTIPAHVLDRAILTPTGYGPLQVGASLNDLTRLGYVKDEDSCTLWQNPMLDNRGLFVHSPFRINQINVNKAGIRTAAGAQVGMTFGQIKSRYGAQLVYKSFDGNSLSYGATVTVGQHQLAFFAEDPAQPLTNSSVVARIIAAPADISWDAFFNC